MSVGAVRPRRLGRRQPRDVRRALRWLGREAGPRVVLIALAVLFVVPLYWMVVTALKTPAELTAFPPSLWAADPQWQNFARAVDFIPFGRYLANTVTITFFFTLGSVVSSFVVAYGLSRFRWPGRELAFYLVLASIFIFVQFPVNPLTMIPLFDIFARLGWINTFLPLTVPAFLGNPFYIFLLRQFLLQIPQEVSEAARIDGAGEWQIMSRVVLPLAGPALATVAIFAAFAAWNDFLGPLIYLQDQSKFTLAIGLSFYQGTHEVQWELLMAASALILLPQLVVFFAFQRAFIRGITLGSTTG